MPPAIGTKAWEFLQDEIEIRRWATFATLEFGAAFTTTFDWLPFHRSSHISVIARPRFSLWVFGSPSDCLHFIAWCVSVGNLHKLSVTYPALLLPQGVFLWAYLSRAIMK